MRFAIQNCSVCGHFVGKDGDNGIRYDSEYGYEVWYPYCKKHLKKEGLG